MPVNGHLKGREWQERAHARLLGRCKDGQSGEFIDEISTEFCCDRAKDEACVDQREWFIIDIKE